MKLFKKKLQKIKKQSNLFYHISILLDHEQMETLSKHYVNQDNSLLTLRELIQIMHNELDDV